METKEIKIQILKGLEIDEENSTLDVIKLKLQENKLPKSWNELGEIKGYFLYGGYSFIKAESGHHNSKILRGVFPEKEQAEAVIALAQLLQIRKKWLEDIGFKDWKPNWKDFDEKHCILIKEDELEIELYFKEFKILSFPTKNLAHKFLGTFKDLLKTAKPLL